MASPKVERAVKAVFQLSWDELGVVEHDGKLYLPSKLRRRTAKGDTDDQAVMLTTVTQQHRIKSRTKTRNWAKEQQLDLDRDKDLVDEWENYELLAFALREPKAPYDQLVPDAKKLWSDYDQVSLRELFQRLDLFTDMVDPRFGELDGEEQWAVIQTIARTGDITPLASMLGFEQASCILTMARAAQRSRTPSSSEP